MEREEVKDYIQKNCIWRGNPEIKYDKNLPPGKLYGAAPGYHDSWLTMMRRFSHNPAMLDYASRAIFKKITELDMDVQLCGLETSSIPIISAIQIIAYNNLFPLNSFTIRKERKKYGLFNLIDGIPNDKRFIVIDDFTNTGSSVRNCCDVSLYELGLDPAPVAFSILRNDTRHGFVYFNGTKIELNSLFNISEFDLEYNPEEYWLPTDVDKSVNKRVDYK